MIKETELDNNVISTKVLARVASITAIICGSAFLLAYIFYYWLPIGILPYIKSIKPNSAFCYILCGISLWIYCEKRSAWLQSLAELSAAAVFLIGILTLLQYFFQTNLGIDQGIIREPTTGTISTIAPAGRMSPIAATNFTLLGFSLLWFDSKVLRITAHQVFLFIVVFLSFLELLGHIYKIGNTGAVFGITDLYSQMSVPSVIIFLLLAFGTLFAQPQHGIMSILSSRYSGGVLARRLIPPAIILPILVGYLVGLGGQWVGFNQAELGISLLVITTIILFALMILINAFLVDKVDIERNQAEHELKLNQLKLQAILDHTTAVIYIQDLEGRYLLINKQFEKVFGKSASEVIGKTPYDVLPHKLAEQVVYTNRKVIQSRIPIGIEEVIHDNNQTQIYFANKFLLRDNQDRIYAIGSIAADITEMNLIHKALRENEERLSLALKSAEAGTWSWDIPNNHFVWDEDTHLLFKLKPGTFPGSYEAFLNLIHPNDRKQTNINVQKALEEGTEYDTEFRTIHPDESIGHTDATYAETVAAVQAGCSHVTHLFNAMRGMHHREPGVLTAALLSSELSAELILDGVHLHPAMVELALRVKGKEKIILVTDAMRAKCMADGEYTLGGQTVFVTHGQAKLADGTLAGSTLTMPQAIKNMMKFTQCSLENVLPFVSANPAKTLKIFDKKGSIAQGKDADLVVLNDQLEVVMTICRGEIVYTSH